MAAKQFYCTECKQWITRPREEETTRGARIEHAKMHAAVDSLFSTPDLMALDAELDFHYHMEP